MNFVLRLVRCLVCGTALMAAGARPALGDWSQPLEGGPRGLREVTLANDGVGGVLIRWVTLAGQIYARLPLVGHADGSGAPPPGWGGYAFLPNINAVDLDIASDGAGGGIVVTSGEGGVRAFHFGADGVTDPGWPAQGIVVYDSTTDVEPSPRVAPDGAGGAYVCWQASPDGTPAAWLTRIDAAGSISTGWPVNGKRLGTWPPDGSGIPELHSDGVGGVIVGLAGSDVRLFRFTQDGAPATGWLDSGALVSTSAGAPDRARVAVASDAASYLAWTEGGGGPLPLRSAPVRVLRVTPDGLVDTRWPQGGRAFAPGTDSLSNPAVVPDDAGGVYLTWGALSSGGARALRGVRLASDGSLAAGWASGGSELVGSSAAFALDNSIYEWEDPAVFAAGTDGAGGLFVAWDDRGASSTPQVRVSRFLSNGLRYPGWLAAGHLIVSPTGIGCVRAVEGNGAGDAFVAWRSRMDVFGTPMLSRVGPDATDGVTPVPVRLALALAPGTRNPSRDALVFTCTLGREGQGLLELYDVSGRRLRSLALEGPAGPYRVAVAAPGELPPGMLFARLSQGSDQRWLRVVVTR